MESGTHRAGPTWICNSTGAATLRVRRFGGMVQTGTGCRSVPGRSIQTPARSGSKAKAHRSMVFHPAMSLSELWRTTRYRANTPSARAKAPLPLPDSRISRRNAPLPAEARDVSGALSKRCKWRQTQMATIARGATRENVFFARLTCQAANGLSIARNDLYGSFTEESIVIFVIGLLILRPPHEPDQRVRARDCSRHAF